jgi:hypothetical protein
MNLIFAAFLFAQLISSSNDANPNEFLNKNDYMYVLISGMQKATKYNGKFGSI